MTNKQGTQAAGEQGKLNFNPIFKQRGAPPMFSPLFSYKLQKTH